MAVPILRGADMTPKPDLHVAAHGTRGDHRPFRSCPCRPLECVELTGGPMGRIVLVHRDLEPVPVLRRIVSRDERNGAA